MGLNRISLKKANLRFMCELSILYSRQQATHVNSRSIAKGSPTGAAVKHSILTSVSALNGHEVRRWRPADIPVSFYLYVNVNTNYFAKLQLNSHG